MTTSDRTTMTRTRAGRSRLSAIPLLSAAMIPVVVGGGVVTASISPSTTFVAEDIDTGAEGAHDVTAADLDGDGNIDLVSVNQGLDTIRWHQHDGEGNFTTTDLADIASSSRSIEVVDLDDDGNLDLLTASRADTIAWYENDGNTNFTEIVVSTSFDGPFSAIPADLDGDGDLDIASASQFDDTIAWFENDGDTNFTAIEIDTTANGALSVTAADIDDDGDIDLVAASGADDTIAWYQNDGDGNFAVADISNTADGAISVTTADLDGDGDIDIASAESSDDTIAWYENDGDGNFTGFDIDTNAEDAGAVTTADLDNDGDIDVISASVDDDTIAWYENDGDGIFTAFDIDTNAEGAFSVTAADLDGDGDIDIASAAFDDDTIAWYENTFARDPLVDAGGPYTGDDGTLITLAATTSDPDGGTPTLAWDFDGDGIFDDATGPTPTFDTGLFGTLGSNTVAVQATDDEGATAVDTATLTIVTPPPAPAVVSLDPERFVDTRAAGVTLDGRFQADGVRVAGSETTVQIGGRGDVPDDAKAVVAYITAVQPADNGFITAHPCLAPRPLASSLNYTADVNLGNEVVIPLNASGELCVFTQSQAHLTLDVVGFIEADSPTTLIDPARFLDTRPAGETIDNQARGDGRVPGGTTYTLPVAGRDDIPSDAAAVIVNITAVAADDIGFITAHACLANTPNAASLNYITGVNRGNEIIAQLDANGDVCLFTSSDVHLTADISGFLPAGTNLTAVDPARFLDTRAAGRTIDGDDQGAGRIPGGTEIRVQIAGRAGIPADADAVELNVTAVQADDVGFVTIHPCRTPLPNTASLNYVAGVNGGNAIITRLDADGQICVFTQSTTHLTIDVTNHLTPI